MDRRFQECEVHSCFESGLGNRFRKERHRDEKPILEPERLLGVVAVGDYYFDAMPALRSLDLDHVGEADSLVGRDPLVVNQTVVDLHLDALAGETALEVDFDRGGVGFIGKQTAGPEATGEQNEHAYDERASEKQAFHNDF
jgi:hypothetical protein